MSLPSVACRVTQSYQGHIDPVPPFNHVRIFIDANDAPFVAFDCDPVESVFMPHVSNKPLLNEQELSILWPGLILILVTGFGIKIMRAML